MLDIIHNKIKSKRSILSTYFINDKFYAKRRYYKTFSKKFNLDIPQTFNEKIQWIKLYDRNLLMVDLADKYKVRNYIKKKIGSKYLNSLLGVYTSYSKFYNDLDNLPNNFILKANHGSGWNEFINKSTINHKRIKKKIDYWLESNYYYKGREWCYKNIKPLIICEKLIQNISNNEKAPNDYKFFCFHGTPMFIQVDINRFNIHQRNLYDTHWNLIPAQLAFSKAKDSLEAPKNLNKMIELATILSKDFNFVRIDFYDEKKIIFGEFTFYPGNGFEKFSPNSFDQYYGQFLKIEDK